ncbi:MAG: hypothetical protein PHY92_04150 [Alphaproteobacteria bacterium]|nr:hypothetical protein [Alphaproteobacteria bacterium]
MPPQSLSVAPAKKLEAPYVICGADGESIPEYSSHQWQECFSTLGLTFRSDNRYRLDAKYYPGDDNEIFHFKCEIRINRTPALCSSGNIDSRLNEDYRLMAQGKRPDPDIIMGTVEFYEIQTQSGHTFYHVIERQPDGDCKERHMHYYITGSMIDKLDYVICNVNRGVEEREEYHNPLGPAVRHQCKGKPLVEKYYPNGEEVTALNVLGDLPYDTRPVRDYFAPPRSAPAGQTCG